MSQGPYQEGDGLGRLLDATQGGSYFSAAINTNGNRDKVINALYVNLVGGTIATNIATQPTFTSVQTELDALITPETTMSETEFLGEIVRRTGCG